MDKTETLKSLGFSVEFISEFTKSVNQYNQELFSTHPLIESAINEVQMEDFIIPIQNQHNLTFNTVIKA